MGFLKINKFNINKIATKIIRLIYFTKLEIAASFIFNLNFKFIMHKLFLYYF